MQNIILNSFFFVIILFTITGISTPVIGALVRYKVPGLIFIIIIINLLYDALKKNHSNSILLIFLIICLSSCNNKIEVDLISHNGIIYSLDDNNNVYEATAFKNGKIIDIGKTHQILNKYQSKNKIDLKGKTAYPGFIDAHCHFLYYGLQLAMVDLSSAKSFEEIIEILKK